MRLQIFALACGLGLVAAGAASADQTQTPMAQPVSAVQTSDPLICHTLIFEGTLIRASECHTKHEWDAIRTRDEQEFRKFQNTALTMPIR